ncbi:hypothetical protein CDD81_6058 [Ophiocordyceps australis]|uniref:tyrosinase n=1 Tax=Ophiocordyceps australis TaxID=1399860 RepID=A0A2C5Y901_9HYPO|nr:hypothetical protein CDD81_6058 [Ophiocordyceps australis]
MLNRIASVVLFGCTLNLVVAFAHAQGYNFGIDISRLTRRQDAASRVIVGKLPLASNGSIPLRVEIRQLRADQLKWDLFILALSMFQSMDQDDPLSWYQIAGIHGVPFQPWNGVEAVAGANRSGYCTHNSVLFPMWHRPYMALFEQRLFKMANAIAGMFGNETQRWQYQQAASDFRMPYWDWSRSAPKGQTHFPDVFWNAVIEQNGPNGVQKIRNPLYSYQFHPLDQDALIWKPIKEWNETKRAPQTEISKIAPPSDNDKVNAALLAKLPEIQQRLYILFSSYHDFNSFSNKGWAASQGLKTLDSIESVHDVIHLYGGSKGHLTYVPLSSFDPLFWLHHTMTDRLIAMWQILNPTAWVAPMRAGETSYTAVNGTLQTSDTPLTPFFASDDGIFWTSNSARSTETFGYTYPETNPSLGSLEDIRKSLVQLISDWYGPASPVGLLKQGQNDGLTASPLSHVSSMKLSAANGHGSHTSKGAMYTEWIANVQVKSGALDGSYGVHLFVGEPPVDTADWLKASNLAGSVAIFSMKHMEGSSSKISGAVPLTRALMKLAAAEGLGDLSPATVTPFLRGSLQVRVLAGDEKQVDPADIEGLHVEIRSARVMVPDGKAELPVWGPSVMRLEPWV